MNPALTPLSRIREMTNTELIAFAKEHGTLTILEREFLRRMDETIDYSTVGILNGAIVRSK